MLDVEGLCCEIATPAGTVRLLDDVSLHVPKARTLGIVGESGSGKSMLLRSILGLAPGAASVTGRVVLAGTDLGSLCPRELRTFIGRHVGIVFQDPMTSLNPVVRVGTQVGEASRYHLGLSKRQARRLAQDLLGSVGIPDASRRADDYPHQFSGGMRQRIMIAMALACEPGILIADEATTALDVTVQKDILDLLHSIQQDRHMTMILVSHDLSIVGGRTDEVAVMYGGQVVERAPTPVIFQDYRHRYTEALLSAVPRIDLPPHTRLRAIPGRPPAPAGPRAGCPFAARCPAVMEACGVLTPPLRTGSTAAHSYRCFVPASHPQPSPSSPDRAGRLP
jgi:peptide/nickel transport system ATP-binding protein